MSPTITMAKRLNIWALLFLLSGQLSYGQADYLTYWVNNKYVGCLESGLSVCDCQRENDFLMLHIDSIKNRLTIEPSIYKSWETLETDIHKMGDQKYRITPWYGIAGEANVERIDNQIYLNTENGQVAFSKLNVRRLQRFIQVDISKQIGIVNARPLVKYLIKPCGNAAGNYLTVANVSEYLSRGQISISCSTDLNYNEMFISTDKSSFFLVYLNDTIKAYKHPPRDMDEVIDENKLKECQLFIRMK